MPIKEFGESPVILTTESGSAGLVETKHYTFSDINNKLLLDNGEKLGPISVAYETYGSLNDSKDNAILIEHALTASAHAAGKNSEDDKYPGWWDVMIGPGKAFDTDKYFVICPNILGSCYGTTGPSSINQEKGRPFGSEFPVITIKDMVRVQKELLDYLEIKRLSCIAGGSMGGMQALEWCLEYPDYVDRLILIASAARSTPQSIAIHKVGVSAIMNDPNWNNGNYYGSEFPKGGLSVARMLGHITYLSDEWLWKKFGRVHTDPANMKKSLISNFEIEKYLEYQGEKFIERFDSNSYIYLLRAIDLYDAAEGFPDLEESFSRVKTDNILIVSFSNDWLYPSYQSKELLEAFRQNKSDVQYNEIQSPYGHDSFLLEYEKLTDLIRGFLN
ncbi:MAG: homoserine O-acetyltransferase [Thermodesulfobacteriota bacterium]